MLSEVRTLEDLTSWQAVRAKFNNDARFQAALRMSSRHAMIWFNEFASKQNAQVRRLNWNGPALIVADVWYDTINNNNNN